LIALLLFARATLDTAAPVDDGPTTGGGPVVSYYVPAGGSGPSGPWTSDVSYSVEAYDLGAIVATGPEGRLCSVAGDGFVDVDGDGRCDLAPPVAIWVHVWPSD